MANNIVAVLDVRSSEISVIVGERGVNNSIAFKANATEAYGGYQDGAFYNEKDFSDAVSRAVASAEKVFGAKIAKLYVGVPGEFTRVVPKQQQIAFKKTRVSSKQINALFQSGKGEIAGYRFMRVTSMIYITSDNRRVANPEGLLSAGLTGILSYYYCDEYFARNVEKIFDSRVQLCFLPTQLAMATYLIPPETRDEYALLLDVGYLSSTISILFGGGTLAEQSFWAGKGQISVRLMQKFNLPFDAADALLSRSNLNLKKEAKDREFNFRDVTYDVPSDELTEEIRAGLDEICEAACGFLEACSGKELETKPIYVTGEGLEGIRGAYEHLSLRLSHVCEPVAPALPYYGRPSMSSKIALVDMACEDNQKRGLLSRILKNFGG